MTTHYVLKIQYVNKPPETRNIGARVTSIGREAGDIVLGDPQSSGRHAEIHFENGGVRVKDLGSTNGTFFGGQRSPEFAMEPGQGFSIGQTVMTLMSIQGAQRAGAGKTMIAVGGMPRGTGAPPRPPGAPPGPPGFGPPPGAPPGPPGAPPQAGFGAPPPSGGLGAPPPGAPPQSGFGAPPPGGGFGAPPPGAPPPGQQGGFGAPPPGAPPPQGAYGAPPQGPPPGSPPQGAYGAPPGSPPQGAYGAPPPGGGFGGPPPGSPPSSSPQPGFGGPPPGGPPPGGGYGGAPMAAAAGGAMAVGAAAGQAFGGPPQGAPPAYGQSQSAPQMSPSSGNSEIRGDFSGTGEQLFGQLFVGILLCMVTGGIYGFWFIPKFVNFMATRITFGPTAKGMVRFSFEGTGGSFFKLMFVNSLLTMVTFGIYGYWAACKAMNWFAENTLIRTDSGEEYRMRFEGQGGDFFVLMLINGMLVGLTLGIYTPWAMCKVTAWRMDNLKILKNGQPAASLEFVGQGGDLLVTFIKGMLLTMVTFGIYSFWFKCKLEAWRAQNTRIVVEGQRFGLRFTGEGAELFGIEFVSFLLRLVTAQIYWFWYVCKVTQWELSNMVVFSEGGAPMQMGMGGGQVQQLGGPPQGQMPYGQPPQPQLGQAPGMGGQQPGYGAPPQGGGYGGPGGPPQGGGYGGPPQGGGYGGPPQGGGYGGPPQGGGYA